MKFVPAALVVLVLLSIVVFIGGLLIVPGIVLHATQ